MGKPTSTDILSPVSPISSPVKTGPSSRPFELRVPSYRPNEGHVRGPCPALNALANRGHLPYDGRNITFGKIVHAMQKGMGLSYGFAVFMAIGTFTLMRRPSLKAFDLHEIDKHGYIEHNASVTRDDTPKGQKYAPLDIDHARLQAFLDKSHVTPTSQGKCVITAETIVDERIELELKSQPLKPLYAEIARAEFAMVLEIFGAGKDKEVPTEAVRTLLEKEEFPPDWKPTHVLHLWDAIKMSSHIRKLMDERRMDEPVAHAMLREPPQGQDKEAHHQGLLELTTEWWQQY
ncbi:hypothetical protein M422DRAFT_36126 [Sphaerobolus stellatus SS14]|uniref:Heme haloperoxidase family profile domain-containing protein n=1 Tax=Sphaerobolus stellatus (strain SS14) TaxID=990650 RepID=A0A0C9UAV5_SPHS4|nr:hypothetical protein M422DRAFT_36126 [Sphaerobolus stellatus SS14]